MSKKANKTVIGLFVVGAAALFVAAILAFGSGALFRQSDKYVLFFDGSVKGLSVGAPVIFRGVKVGSVDEISLVYDAKSKDVLIPVIIDVELDRVKGVPERLGYPDYNSLIKRGLMARLEIQNFITSQLMIGFDFYPDREPKLYGLIKNYPELPALPTSPDIFEVMDEVPILEISKNLDETVSWINRLVNSGGLYELGNALQEVSGAARSIRLLADYLEEHPEAILKGKTAIGE